MAYFVWKQEKSSDLKIIIKKLPDIIRAKEKVIKSEVEGRSGFLIESLGTYEGVTKSVECTLLPGADIDYISAWLTGGGEIEFSNEPDKAYQAYIVNQIPFKHILNNFRSFIIQFDCQPFKLNTVNTRRVLTSAGDIVNYGTIEADPVIKIIASGDVTLTINNANVILTGVDGYITIDSVLMDAYKDTTLQNSKMLGEFPKLKTGANAFSWVGNVTSVEVTFREKYL